MKARLPVARHLARRSWRRLVVGMPPRLPELLARDHLSSPIVVKPSLSRFKTCGNRMSRSVKMLGGMLTGRTVAAADVPAFSATPQMKPPPACCEALNAALAARGHIRIDSKTFSLHGCFLRQQQYLRVLPFANAACASAASRRGTLLRIGIVNFSAPTASAVYSKFFVSCLDTKATMGT